MILILIAQVGVGYIYGLVRAHLASVKVKVARFNHLTGEVTLAFVNDTDFPVPVEIAYITVSPTNNSAMKPLPPELVAQMSVLDRFAVQIPIGGAIEIGPYCHPQGRPICMAAVLVRDDAPIVLPPGVTITNISPLFDAFTKICQQYPEKTELKVLLHTSLVDARGHARTQEIPLGNYSFSSNHSALNGRPCPMEIDVLRKAKYGGTNSARFVYTCSGEQELPMLDLCRVAILQNTGSAEFLLRIGENITGLVPVVFILKSIMYGCHFSVDLNDNDRIPPDLASWILSRDGGNTVMNLPMAFSDNWSNASMPQYSGLENRINLPTNQWKILTDGHKWAAINEGVVSYRINQHAWLKLMPVGETTTSNLNSEYFKFTQYGIGDDSSWTLLTNYSCFPTNYQTYLLVNHEIIPDLAMVTNIVVSTNSSNNTLSE